MAYKPLKRELLPELPTLYETEHQEDPLIYAHFHSPANGWHWYIQEGREEEGDLLMFGLVVGFETEMGYISFDELQSVYGQVWIDVDWTPKPRSEVRASIRR